MTEFFYLGRHQIAQRTDGVVTYVHTDALGSVTRKTNAAGVLIEDRVYEPCGESLEVTTRAPQWPQGMAYTGHVLDNLTRLTYAQARHYDQLMGRFMSVDPVDSDAVNFNRYWYANNNPFNMIDPDGRKSCKVGDTGCNLERGDRGGSSSGYYGANGKVLDNDASDLNSTSGAPLPNGNIPVPGIVGWKTGEYTATRTPEQLDAEGKMIAGIATLGGGAVAVDLAAPYAIFASGAVTSGAKNFWKNISFDGPSPGAAHANGRLFGVRWKGGQWGIRLDLHPINSGATPILHINYGPLGRGEAAHVVIFDPRWFRGE